MLSSYDINSNKKGDSIDLNPKHRGYEHESDHGQQQQPQQQRQRRSLIVGGSIVSETNEDYSAYTWTGIGSGGWGCGGTLIHSDIVLSAAHCQSVFEEIGGLYVGPKHIDGSDVSSGRYHDIVNMTVHPNFDGTTMRNDLLLVKLKTTKSSSTVEPVVWNTDSEIPITGDTVEVIGFGMTSESDGTLSEQLRCVNVTVSDKEICSNVWQLKRNITINKSQKICAGTFQGGKDSCDSDSGSPLFVRRRSPSSSSPKGGQGQRQQLIQVGIVSDGIGCGRPNIPALYTRVSSFTTWIRHNICTMSHDPPTYCNNNNDKTTMTSVVVNDDDYNDNNSSKTGKQKHPHHHTISSDNAMEGSRTNNYNWLGYLIVPALIVVGYAFHRRRHNRRIRHRRNGYDTISDDDNDDKNNNHNDNLDEGLTLKVQHGEK